MWWQVMAAANVVISLAYFGITAAILLPLVRARAVRANRLGLATAAIFFSCAVGHGMHALHALLAPAGAPSAADSAALGVHWHEALWDALTAAVAVYYLTLRRTYGALMGGAAQFEDLEHQRRVAAVNAREAVVAARAVAERERDAHAAMLRVVIANNQSLIYVKDLEGRYLLANGAFERAFGVTEAALVGQTDAYLDAELAPVWRANDLRAQRGAYQVLEWSEGPAGRRTYETVKFPLHDTDGRLYAICGVSLDVTTRERATEDLQAARDAALAGTAAKSAFLATMSHEIRTPMNAVIGLTGLLLDTELDAQQRDFVETVRASGDTLLNVINDILDFSKIESGELELEEESFDLQDCVETVLGLLAPAATEKGLDLVSHLDPGCPGVVVGDVTRLRQVLVNLVSNAVKFTRQGDVLIEVTCLGDSGGRLRLRFEVTDTGIGIPADRMDRLFRSFSQVDASTTRVYGGTGLGLAISSRLVAAMGGELVVRSEPGVGSTFSFVARVETGDDSAARTAAAPVLAVLHGRSALVVDDNATNCRILRLQLEGWGFACAAVETPAAALALVLAGTAYDVALLDMHMPDMDGQQLAGQLRRLPAGKQLPLILLTSLGTRPPDLPPGVTVLTKPVKAVTLRNTLASVLRASTAARPGTNLPGPRGPGPAAPGLRILLAEDNAVNAKVARLMIGRLGHRIDTVSNGREALDAVQRVQYDVVFMDVRMPEMDGLAATRAIRATGPVDRQPRIVAMTASALVDDREACRAAGMDDYLSKPVRLDDLQAALARTPSAAPAGGALVATSKSAPTAVPG
jgi:two-component system, sensor histidine kinase and response regulator